MTRQVPEPGQGIIMWKSNRKEDERKNGWFYVYRNLVVTCAAAACDRACVSHKGSVQLPGCRKTTFYKHKYNIRNWKMQAKIQKFRIKLKDAEIL